MQASLLEPSEHNLASSLWTSRPLMERMEVFSETIGSGWLTPWNADINEEPATRPSGRMIVMHVDLRRMPSCDSVVGGSLQQRFSRAIVTAMASSRTQVCPSSVVVLLLLDIRSISKVALSVLLKKQVLSTLMQSVAWSCQQFRSLCITGLTVSLVFGDKNPLAEVCATTLIRDHGNEWKQMLIASRVGMAVDVLLCSAECAPDVAARPGAVPSVVSRPLIIDALRDDGEQFANWWRSVVEGAAFHPAAVRIAVCDEPEPSNPLRCVPTSPSVSTERARSKSTSIEHSQSRGRSYSQATMEAQHLALGMIVGGEAELRLYIEADQRASWHRVMYLAAAFGDRLASLRCEASLKLQSLEDGESRLRMRIVHQEIDGRRDVADAVGESLEALDRLTTSCRGVQLSEMASRHSIAKEEDRMWHCIMNDKRTADPPHSDGVLEADGSVAPCPEPLADTLPFDSVNAAVFDSACVCGTPGRAENQHFGARTPIPRTPAAVDCVLTPVFPSSTCPVTTPIAWAMEPSDSRTPERPLRLGRERLLTTLALLATPEEARRPAAAFEEF